MSTYLVSILLVVNSRSREGLFRLNYGDKQFTCEFICNQLSVRYMFILGKYFGDIYIYFS